MRWLYEGLFNAHGTTGDNKKRNRVGLLVSFEPINSRLVFDKRTAF